jgi:hypothetical protein
VPESNRPVSPSDNPPVRSPHSVSKSTRRNWRLGDFPQMMIKRQEESLGVNLYCAMISLAFTKYAMKRGAGP